jgi:hypothetical protein
MSTRGSKPILSIAMWFHVLGFYNYIHHLERPLVTLEFQNVPKSALIFPSKPPISTLRFSFKTYF